MTYGKESWAFVKQVKFSLYVCGVCVWGGEFIITKNLEESKRKQHILNLTLI